jgi:hypothetical protein
MHIITDADLLPLPDLVTDGHILVKQDWDNVSHLVLDLLPICICAHGQVLLYLDKRIILGQAW